MSKMNCNNDDIGSDCQWWNDGICEHSETCGEPRKSQPLKPGEHTPGPWKIVSPKEGGCLDQTENRLIGSIVNKHPYHIAETFQYRNEEFNAADGVSLGNARLIAAAPDLLTACKHCLPWMAKAVESGAFKGCVAPRGGLAALDELQAAIAKATT